MKILLLKYICIPIICLTSGYSYLFLSQQSAALSAGLQQSKAPKEKRVLLHNPKTNSTQMVIIAPPKDTAKDQEKEKEGYAQKDKNMLPDVEFLKFIIDKGKEGIPVLKFNGFFAWLP